jgi:hypothetical protein
VQEKMKKKEHPERPINISKMIEKLVEKRGNPLSLGGVYLPDETRARASSS